MGNTASLRTHLEAEFARLNQHLNDTSENVREYLVLDQLLQLKQTKDRSVDLMHLGILFVLDNGLKGYYVLEDFLALAQVCLGRLEQWKDQNLQTQLQAHCTLEMWHMVSGTNGHDIFADWFCKVVECSAEYQKEMDRITAAHVEDDDDTSSYDDSSSSEGDSVSEGEGSNSDSGSSSSSDSSGGSTAREGDDGDEGKAGDGGDDVTSAPQASAEASAKPALHLTLSPSTATPPSTSSNTTPVSTPLIAGGARKWSGVRTVSRDVLADRAKLGARKGYADMVPEATLRNIHVLLGLHDAYGYSYSEFLNLCHQAAEEEKWMDLLNEKWDDYLPLKVLEQFAYNFVRGFTNFMKHLGFDRNDFLINDEITGA